MLWKSWTEMNEMLLSCTAGILWTKLNIRQRENFELSKCTPRAKSLPHGTKKGFCISTFFNEIWKIACKNDAAPAEQFCDTCIFLMHTAKKSLHAEFWLAKNTQISGIWWFMLQHAFSTIVNWKHCNSILGMAWNCNPHTFEMWMPESKKALALIGFCLSFVCTVHWLCNLSTIVVWLAMIWLAMIWPAVI